MTEPTSPQGAAVTEDQPLESLHALLNRLEERGATIGDLTRAASRHCRRMLDCEVARIWIPRRGGRRLVSQDIADEGDEPRASYRLRRGEGLAGWVVMNGQALRLGTGETPPDFKGTAPPFRSALVMPLFQRNGGAVPLKSGGVSPVP